MSLIALDSNILVYLAGTAFVPADIPKIARVQALVGSLNKVASLVAPVQALGELFVVLKRAGAAPAEARDIVSEYSQAFLPAASLPQTVAAAVDLVVEHKFQLWDALILTAGSQAGCTMLLSEDMQQGFVHRGLTIVNPLADTPHPQLARLLDLPA